jgi:hypothetical protein
MVGTPGEEIAPSDFVNPIFETVELDPPESSAGVAIRFNHNYAVYVDNTGSGGATTRMWIDGPDLGEFVAGPRAGGSNFSQVRLRHSKVSGVAGVVLRQDSGGVLYLTSSSRRYKRQITDHSIDLDALRRLRVVKFKDRTQIEDNAIRIATEARGEGAEVDEADVEQATAEGEWYVGVIAEEVEELGLTELLTYEDDPDRPGARRPGGFRYELVALGALQLLAEQEARMRTLEETVARLAEQVSELHDIEQQRKG